MSQHYFPFAAAWNQCSSLQVHKDTIWQFFILTWNTFYFHKLLLSFQYKLRVSNQQFSILKQYTVAHFLELSGSGLELFQTFVKLFPPFVSANEKEEKDSPLV